MILWQGGVYKTILLLSPDNEEIQQTLHWAFELFDATMNFEDLMMTTTMTHNDDDVYDDTTNTMFMMR